MDMMGEMIEQRAGKRLALKDARPFLEWEFRGDNGRSTLVALAEDLEEELDASLREWHIAKLLSRVPFARVRFTRVPCDCREPFERLAPFLAQHQGQDQVRLRFFVAGRSRC